MKNLLILLALAGLGTAVGCGDDEGGGDDKTTPAKDAGTGTPDAKVARPQQIDTDKLGNECTVATEKTACTGAGGKCLEKLGSGMNTITFEDGYCTASCEASAECGSKGGCPVYDIIAALPPTLASIVPPSLITSFIPSNCYEKCESKEDCRGDYTCSSISAAAQRLAPALAGQVPASPATMQTYCFPPVSLPDAGVPDAGSTTVVGGIDAGT